MEWAFTNWLCEWHQRTSEPYKIGLDFTDKMLKMGRLIDIEVFDHKVLPEDTYFTLR